MSDIINTSSAVSNNVTDSSTINTVELNKSINVATLIKGDKGDKGDPGENGKDGINGKDGSINISRVKFNAAVSNWSSRGKHQSLSITSFCYVENFKNIIINVYADLSNDYSVIKEIRDKNIYALMIGDDVIDFKYKSDTVPTDDITFIVEVINAKTLDTITNSNISLIEAYYPYVCDYRRDYQSHEIQTTLSAASWNNATYTINDSNIYSDSTIILSASNSITVNAYDAMCKAKVILSSQTNGTVILKALGDVPTIDIPVTITVQGGV